MSEREQAAPPKTAARRMEVKILFMSGERAQLLAGWRSLLTRRRGISNCEKTGAPREFFARRIPKFFGGGVQRRSVLPWRVMALNPDAMAVTPSPMARNPVPPHPFIPIPRPMGVIGAIANRHVNPERFRRSRHHGPCAHQRGQQHSKFIFHNGVLSLSLL